MNLPRHYQDTLYCYSCKSAITAASSFAQSLSLELAKIGYQELTVAGVRGLTSIYYCSSKCLIDDLKKEYKDIDSWLLQGDIVPDRAYQWSVNIRRQTITPLNQAYRYFRNGKLDF